MFRRNNRPAVRAAVLALMVVGAAAQNDRTPGDAISSARLEAYLSVIAADFTRGRETGSEGYDIAAEYAASLFKVWGVQPGGDVPDPLVRLRTGRQRSYFQSVPLIRNAEAPETTMTLTAGRSGFRKETIFHRRTDFDVEATIPFDVAAEVVFAGYGSMEPDFDELRPLNLRDKFVVVLDGLPGQTHAEGALYKKMMDARRARMDRMKQAIERGEADETAGDDSRRRFLQALRDSGAAGCIIAALPADGGLASSPPPVAAAWSINAPFRNLPLPVFKMFEGDQPPARQRPLRLPAGPIMAPAGSAELFRDRGDPIMISISAEAAEALISSSGQHLEELRRRIDSTGRPASFPLAGVTLRIQNAVRTEIVNGKNVIGLIPGSDPVLKNEYVVVCAHLDHIGAFNNVIFNGADDNASGAAAVLELARAFSAAPIPPKRTLVFCLWCGEEHGFLGSRYFIDRPPVPGRDIIACLNMDMIGRLSRPQGPSARKLVVHTSCQTPVFKRIAEESCRLAGLEAEFVEDKIEGLTRSGGTLSDSDHVAFAARDIGFIHLETGVHDDWHSFIDHADKINFDGLEKIARAAFLAAKAAADLDSRPVYDKSISAPKKKNRFQLLFLEDKGADPPAGQPGGAAAPRETVLKVNAARPENKPAAPIPTTAAPALQPVEAAAKEKTGSDTRLLRLTFDLLGKTDDSRFEGTIAVYAGDRKLFESGTVILRGFREERGYSREFNVAGVNLAKDGLRWIIKGTLFDSALKESFASMKMDSRALAEPFRGIGYHLSTAGGKFEVKPIVF